MSKNKQNTTQIYNNNLNIVEKYAQKITNEQELWIEKMNEFILTNRELIQKYCAVKFYFNFYDNDISGVKHYYIDYDACDYDDSGELVEDGVIDTSDTVYDVLNHEYNGEWIPTFQSGSGRYWNNFNDDYEEYYRNISELLLVKFLIQNANDVIGTKMEENDAKELYEYLANSPEEIPLNSYTEFYKAYDILEEKEFAMPFGDFLKLGKDNMTFIYNFCKENNFDKLFCNYYERENEHPEI